ncbi:aldo/keto reductase [Stutzerimonas zhaodongensis]|uniref:Aldo/keto reductase n=1 Tax=Stutzerimonas zhaodongensis TaxID=1176257 RepID=A0A3M2HU79_9GAMM|nr:aldo/keto reductase [Stutzerimonas zhaodongensis]MCQ4316833.1 aldo/keto reductase [Stutzerimonas zhaodongensis]RMH92578.1 aldo/keto reductase [Stutzerimonas zhaodongensis]
MQRRQFLSTTAGAGVALALGPAFARAQTNQNQQGAAPQSPDRLPMNEGRHERYRPPYRFGLGGAIGLGDMRREMPEAEALALLQQAWDLGIRYYDTSPWYGLGLSERRHAGLLSAQERDAYVLSTKVGRLLKPEAGYAHKDWKGVNNFNYEYDYSASGTRRSIEDSLQRMGVPSLDVVFIHDLSPDNEDMGEGWKEHFEVAVKGAMPELVKMREEGLIKAWGMGVNTLPPALGAIERSDPDIILSATQYSLLKHKDALNDLFPAAEKRGVSLVLGAPLNSGYLAGNEYFNYSKEVPEDIQSKRERYRALAREHGVDLRTAALQFCNAPSVVSAVIPGASKAEHIRENAASMSARIPGEFWSAAKREGLLEENAPIPG